MEEKDRKKIGIGEDILTSFLPGGDTLSALLDRQSLGEWIGNGIAFNAGSFPTSTAHVIDSLKKGRAIMSNVGGKAKYIENPKNALQRLLLSSAVGGGIELGKKRLLDRE